MMFFFFAKIAIFCKSVASDNALDSQLATIPNPTELHMALYQGLYGKFVSMMSPKCWIVENDSELIFMALHTLFLPQQQYSLVYVHESSHCRVEEWSVFGGWFSWFLGRQLTNNWLCITQIWLFCVVLVVQLRHVQFLRKNRRSIAWKCFARATFVGFGSCWNTHTVDCCLLSGSNAYIHDSSLVTMSQKHCFLLFTL